MEKDNTYENSNIEVTETSRLEAENIMETSAGELVASQKAQNPGVLADLLKVAEPLRRAASHTVNRR